jgi:hypothetical protein
MARALVPPAGSGDVVIRPDVLSIEDVGTLMRMHPCAPARRSITGSSALVSAVVIGVDGGSYRRAARWVDVACASLIGWLVA